jgi:pyruvate,orthophosphate dikinase
MKQWVYGFEEGGSLARTTNPTRLHELLGGKGAGLAEMASLSLPVPPGFTITTEACKAYFKAGKRFPTGLWNQVLEALQAINQKYGRGFGDRRKPLLVSVRSGAKFSMPGMMDTILNLGLNEQTIEGLIHSTDNERFSYDAYRRLLQMFGRIAMGIDGHKFEDVLDRHKSRRGLQTDTDLDCDDLKAIVQEYQAIVRQQTGREFPRDPYEQLKMAIEAVFESWFGKRATDYRNFYGISHDLGTAVNVQTMVFGNMGKDSATGVAFTRDPATGEKRIFGEYLSNAQGEDVVAGVRTPKPIEQLKEDLPQAYREFVRICGILERHYRDVQDVEFTIEEGKLWMLQTRTAKRTAQAAVKLAVDMVGEGLITKPEAVLRVAPEQIDQVLHPRFDERAKKEAYSHGAFIAKGLNASPGAAVGMVIFDADTAEARSKSGEAVILVRPETNPDDVHGMLMAKGILTQHGGATSHAAVVARGLGKPAVVGCESLAIDIEGRRFSGNGRTVREGDRISIDGGTGEIFAGALPLIEPRLEEQKELVELLSWADQLRRLEVWANADYPRDAERARSLGAEGVGLCRTEHMFFEEDRLPIVQQMILAETDEERQVALNKLLPIQKEDFKGIFRAMDGLPVIIRLIDPPLHEFLPAYDQLLVDVTELRCGGGDRHQLVDREAILKKVASMREANPMLGLRGVRLGILWPAITEMQVRAIFEAACELVEAGIEVHPEIMIPLVGHVNELKVMRQLLEGVAKKVMEERHIQVEYKFGSMIEVPRAAITADKIAQHAQFFSFGTNDLTQMVFGISRDDAEGKFLLQYVEKGLLPNDPFQRLDIEGVGALMKIAVERGRKAHPDLEIGICGEHGGDPSSIEFCHELNLNYVSCSPFRVPVARLAAAHAALREEQLSQQAHDQR